MTSTSVVGKKSKYIESQEHYRDEVKGEKNIWNIQYMACFIVGPEDISEHPQACLGSQMILVPSGK